MNAFLYIFIILIVICTVVMLSKVKIIIHYQHYDKNDEFNVVIKALFGLITKKINVPVVKTGNVDSMVDFQVKSKEEKAPTKKKITMHDIFKSFDNTRKFIHSVIDAKPILRHYCKGIEVRELTWNSSLGMKDAALTGKVAGVAWGMVGLVERFLYAYLTVRCKPAISFTPYFNRRIIETHLHCIVYISIGKTIITAVKLLVHYKRKGYRFRSASFMRKESM
ncbi:MAG: DUF2953 domain-containing protein [Bacillus sp. (in: firmicutes)]